VAVHRPCVHASTARVGVPDSSFCSPQVRASVRSRFSGVDGPLSRSGTMRVNRRPRVLCDGDSPNDHRRSPANGQYEIERKPASTKDLLYAQRSNPLLPVEQKGLRSAVEGFQLPATPVCCRDAHADRRERTEVRSEAIDRKALTRAAREVQQPEGCGSKRAWGRGAWALGGGRACRVPAAVVPVP